MTSVRHYAREVERYWADLLERPALLGERDWALITDWHERGIPLALVAQAVEQFVEKRKGHRRDPRSLSVLAPAIEDAWKTVQSGILEDRSAPALVAPPNTGGTWNLNTMASDDPLRVWLQSLLDRLAAGESAAACEAELDDQLLDRLSSKFRAGIQAGVEKEFSAFRARMTEGTWRTTLRRGMLTTARRRLGLPALTDPVPSPQTDETF